MNVLAAASVVAFLLTLSLVCAELLMGLKRESTAQQHLRALLAETFPEPCQIRQTFKGKNIQMFEVKAPNTAPFLVVYSATMQRMGLDRKWSTTLRTLVIRLDFTAKPLHLRKELLLWNRLKPVLLSS